MKCIAMAVSNQLLGLNEKELQNDMSWIIVSALGYKYLHIKHPKFEMKCPNPIIIENSNNSIVDANIENSNNSIADANIKKSFEPNEVGRILTTNIFSNSNCLGKFELDARNFPNKGIHTTVDGKIMERWMYVDVQSKVSTLLRFDRNFDISNIRGVD